MATPFLGTLQWPKDISKQFSYQLFIHQRLLATKSSLMTDTRLRTEDGARYPLAENGAQAQIMAFVHKARRPVSRTEMAESRLSIYRPWLIATYENIRTSLRRLSHISPYGSEVPAPALPNIDVEERDGTRVCTERLLRIRPLSLPPGAHIDLEGDRQEREQTACGPQDERFFEWQLVCDWVKPWELQATNRNTWRR
jgi:hypothetical protein